MTKMFTVIDSLNLENPKTKDAVALMVSMEPS